MWFDWICDPSESILGITFLRRTTAINASAAAPVASAG